jgi:hypothetical protein
MGAGPGGGEPGVAAVGAGHKYKKQKRVICVAIEVQYALVARLLIG